MFDYYTAPSQEIFDDLKAKCIELWNTYDDTYGYASEKIKRIESIKNFKDNACYMVAMFDINNQAKLLTMVNEDTKDWLRDLFMDYYQQAFNAL